MSIAFDVSISEYHSSSTYCSHSRFRDFVEKGARYYYERYVSKTIERNETKAMRIGQIFETLVQDGDAAFEALIFHQREDGRKIKDQLASAKAAGLFPLKGEEYAMLQNMRASLFDCMDGMALIEGADKQPTITGNAYGIAMQSRPDWVCLEGLAYTDYRPYTVDLKTCDNLDGLRGDASKLIALGHHTQAALCRALMRDNGIPDSEHYLFAVEKQGACRSALIRLRPELLDWADQYFMKYAGELAHCIRTNTWPRAEPTCEVGIPRWAQSGAPTDELPPDMTDDEETDHAE